MKDDIKTAVIVSFINLPQLWTRKIVSRNHNINSNLNQKLYDLSKDKHSIIMFLRMTPKIM